MAASAATWLQLNAEEVEETNWETKWQPTTWQLDIRVSYIFFMDGTQKKFGLLIGPNLSVAVLVAAAAAGQVAVHYGGNGETPSA